MSKVDRRIAKSQEAIKNAVIELMSEKNFDDITIQEISDRANVSRGTIYLHYLDKYDLLDKLITEHIEELRDMVQINIICSESFKTLVNFTHNMLSRKTFTVRTIMHREINLCCKDNFIPIGKIL
jgi:AcrR family transcriptional regulator